MEILVLLGLCFQGKTGRDVFLITRCNDSASKTAQHLAWPYLQKQVAVLAHVLDQGNKIHRRDHLFGKMLPEIALCINPSTLQAAE